MLKKGILISVEGIDGSGKSTLAKNLNTLLKAQDIKTLLTKEPGGTILGKELRSLLQERVIAINPIAEFLLFAADRAQHFNELIIPALKQNMLIISDRMADSSLAYQGYGRGLDKEYIQSINAFAMNSIKPNLTIFCEVPIALATERLKNRNVALTSFEKENNEFMERTLKGFHEIFKSRSNVLWVDGTKNQEELAQTTYEMVLAWLTKNHLL